MRRRLLGRSSERLPEAERRQLWLFNEAETLLRSESDSGKLKTAGGQGMPQSP
jgi:hypothetical protein